MDVAQWVALNTATSTRAVTGFVANKARQSRCATLIITPALCTSSGQLGLGSLHITVRNPNAIFEETRGCPSALCAKNLSLDLSRSPCTMT